MKLGEALSLRARQAQRLDDLRGRIRANVLVQEGESASEPAETLILEFESLSDEHQKLVQAIARTNVEVQDKDGYHLIEHLHRRETLRRKRNMHQEAASQATPSGSDRFRYMRSELRQVSQINVPAHRQKVAELDEEIRQIDAKIQESNWQIDLLEAY